MKFLKVKFTLFMSTILFSVFALCQAVSPIPAVVFPPVPVAPSWLVSLATAHPWILSVLVFVGGARLLLKPLFAGLHAFFQGAGLTAYDQKETAIEQSKFMSVVFFVLDYLGSIKMPVAAAAPVVPPVSSQPPAAS